MKLIVMCALLTACFSATAAEWKVIGSGGNTTHSIDASSVAVRGPVHQAWTMWSSKALPPNSQQEVASFFRQDANDQKSGKSLFYFGCTSKKIGLVQTISYSGENGAGEVTDSRSITPEQVFFEEVAPDTVAEAMLKFVCAYRPPVQKGKPTT